MWARLGTTPQQQADATPDAGDLATIEALALLGERMWDPVRSAKAYPNREDFVRDCVPILRREWMAAAAIETDASDIDVDALHQGWLKKARRAGQTACCRRVSGMSATKVSRRMEVTSSSASRRIPPIRGRRIARVVPRPAT
jgi:hypothetical protein